MPRSTLPASLRLPMLVLAAAALLGLVPTLARSHDEPNPGAIAKALTVLDDEWSKAAVARDVDRVASFYADDAVAYPPGEPVSVGRDAARKVWAAYFADPSFTISWKTTHAEASRAGDLGMTSGTYEASYKGADGQAVREVGKYLCVWKAQKDGSWKAVHDMWNTDTK